MSYLAYSVQKKKMTSPMMPCASHHWTSCPGAGVGLGVLLTRLSRLGLHLRSVGRKIILPYRWRPKCYAFKTRVTSIFCSRDFWLQLISGKICFFTVFVADFALHEFHESVCSHVSQGYEHCEPWFWTGSSVWSWWNLLGLLVMADHVTYMVLREMREAWSRPELGWASWGKKNT